MKLTEAQRRLLAKIQDWTSATELAIDLKWDGRPNRAAIGHMQWRLNTLLRLGLAQCHCGNNTFRLTDAGRAALTGGECGNID